MPEIHEGLCQETYIYNKALFSLYRRICTPSQAVVQLLQFANAVGEHWAILCCRTMLAAATLFRLLPAVGNTC